MKDNDPFTIYIHMNIDKIGCMTQNDMEVFLHGYSIPFQYNRSLYGRFLCGEGNAD